MLALALRILGHAMDHGYTTRPQHRPTVDRVYKGRFCAVVSRINRGMLRVIYDRGGHGVLSAISGLSYVMERALNSNPWTTRRICRGRLLERVMAFSSFALVFNTIMLQLWAC